MPLPNPDHYLDQAEKLIRWSGGRQAELRRAISTAYYAVFHTVMRAAADAYLGRSNQKTEDYARAYRHIDHDNLKNVCAQYKKQAADHDESATLANSDLRAFAQAVVELHARRNAADYDPSLDLRVSDARAVVAAARDAIERFGNLPMDRKLTFLFQLMVKTKERR